VRAEELKAPAPPAAGETAGLDSRSIMDRASSVYADQSESTFRNIAVNAYALGARWALERLGAPDRAQEGEQ
jgi:hypothetical protein